MRGVRRFGRTRDGIGVGRGVRGRTGVMIPGIIGEGEEAIVQGRGVVAETGMMIEIGAEEVEVTMNGGDEHTYLGTSLF